jgi:hypothetical protein
MTRCQSYKTFICHSRSAELGFGDIAYSDNIHVKEAKWSSLQCPTLFLLLPNAISGKQLRGTSTLSLIFLQTERKEGRKEGRKEERFLYD